jgi:hypothetical protein
MHKLESLLPGDKITSIDAPDCMIYDGHAIIQMLPVPPTENKVKFLDMAASYYRHIMTSSCPQGSVRQIHIVFDRYLEDSLKGQTRQKRGDVSGSHRVHIQSETAVPTDWKRFLMMRDNKESLAKFYTEYLIENVGRGLKLNKKFWLVVDSARNASE